jgi:hypothetical protein
LGLFLAESILKIFSPGCPWYLFSVQQMYGWDGEAAVVVFNIKKQKTKKE